MMSGNPAGGGGADLFSMLRNYQGQMGGGLRSLFSGLFGDSGAPYGDAMKQYQKYYGDATAAQNPFVKAGQGGMENYQRWLEGMKDPGAFINKTMQGYNESPWAHNLQQQSIRAGQNAASASGMGGSTPFAQQLQQNSGNISSQDQNQWLQNVLGVNTQYGAGQNQLMQGGQHASDILSQLAMLMGGQMGEGAFGQKYGRDKDRNDIFSGAMSLFGF